MNRSNLNKKGLVVAVILLFIGVAIAPSINAIVIEDDLVELDVEFCGLGEKHTVKMTQDEIEELKLIISDMFDALDKTNTREERNQIIQQRFYELEKFNLFGNIGVKKSIELASNPIKSNQIRNDMSYYSQNGGIENLLCFLYGSLEDSFITLTSLSFLLMVIFENLWFLADDLGLFELGRFFFYLSTLAILYGFFKPVNIMSIIINVGLSGVGFSTITSHGLYGEVFSSRLDAIIGYTGLKIIINEGDYNQFLIGTALVLIKE